MCNHLRESSKLQTWHTQNEIRKCFTNQYFLANPNPSNGWKHTWSDPRRRRVHQILSIRKTSKTTVETLVRFSRSLYCRSNS